MALENKLGITNSVELARKEERISKRKAVELFESGALDKLAPADLRRCKPFIRRFSRIFMTLQAKCAR